MKTVPKIEIPYFSYVKQLLTNPIALRTKVFEEYGDIARKKLAGTDNYFVGHPIYAEHILGTHQNNYFNRHPGLRKPLAPFCGDIGIMTNNNPESWHRDRIIAKMSFNPNTYFKQYSETIISLCNDMLEKWENRFQDNEMFNVAREIDTLIINITCNTFFTHFEMVDAEEFCKFATRYLQLFRKKFASLLKPIWYLSPAAQEYNASIRYIRTLACDLVRQRIENNKKWDDMLSNFIHESHNLSKEELIQALSYHVSTFAVMSFLSTISLVHWVLIVLSYYPTVEREVCQELNSVIGSRLPQYDDLKSLPYLSAVLKETLRLYPPLFTLMRQSITDDEINGFYIPAKSGIILSVYHIHRHVDFWENPEGFDPLRFIDNPFGQENRFAYIPFGADQRRCVAEGFSTMEVMLIIAMILQRFHLYIPTNTKVKPLITTLATMRPDVNMMNLKRRY